MLRTILWYSFFWLYMVFSLFLSIPVILLSIPGFHQLRDRYITFTVSNWSRSLIRMAGGKITVVGREHVPDTGPVCFVANHQGAFDIPIVLGHLPGPIGFIAKKELAWLPIINIWMMGIGCIFIDRSNRRAAVDSIRRGVEQINNGRAMIIFPEGTRSRGPRMNPFRPGSLKLPIRSKATIVPISISGSYKLKELKHRIQPADVTVTIHKPIPGTSYSEEETKNLSNHLTTIISRAL